MVRGILYTFEADDKGGYNAGFKTTVIDIEYSASADSDAELTAVMQQSLLGLPKQDGSAPFFVAFISGKDMKVFSSDKGRVAKINVTYLGVVKQEDGIPQGSKQLTRTPAGRGGGAHLARPQLGDGQNPDPNAGWERVIESVTALGKLSSEGPQQVLYRKELYRNETLHPGLVFLSDDVDEGGEIRLVQAMKNQNGVWAVDGGSKLSLPPINSRNLLGISAAAGLPFGSNEGGGSVELPPIKPRAGDRKITHRPRSIVFGNEATTNFQHDPDAPSVETGLNSNMMRIIAMNKARGGNSVAAPYSPQYESRTPSRLNPRSTLGEQPRTPLRLTPKVLTQLSGARPAHRDLWSMLSGAPTGVESQRLKTPSRGLYFAGSVTTPSSSFTPKSSEEGSAVQEQDDYVRAYEIFNSKMFQDIETRLLKDKLEQGEGFEEILGIRINEWMSDTGLKCNKNVAHFLGLFVENQYWREEYKYLSQKNECLGLENRSMNDSMADLKGDVDQSRSIAQRAAAASGMDRNTVTTLEEREVQDAQTIEALKRENQDLKDQVARLQVENQQLQSEMSDLTKEHTAELARFAQAKLQDIAKLNQDHAEEIALSKAALSRLEADNEGLVDANEALSLDLKVAVAKIALLEGQMKDVVREKDAAVKAANIAREGVASAKEELAQSKERLAEALAAEKQAKDALVNSQQSGESLAEAFAKVGAVEGVALVDVSAALVAELRAKIAELEKEVARLRTDAAEKEVAAKKSVEDFAQLQQQLGSQTELQERFRTASEGGKKAKEREDAYTKGLDALEEQVKRLEDEAKITDAAVLDTKMAAITKFNTDQAANIPSKDVSLRIAVLSARLEAVKVVFVTNFQERERVIAALQVEKDAAVKAQEAVQAQLDAAITRGQESTAKSVADTARIAELTAENAALLVTVAYFTAQIAQLTAEKAEQAKTIKALKKTIEEQLTTIATLTTDLAKEQRDRAVEKAALEGRIVEADAANQRLDSERKHLQAKQTASDQAAAAHAVAIVAAQEERNVAVTALAQANADHAAALALVGSDADGAKAALQARIKELTAVIAERDATIADLKNRLEAEQAKNATLTQQVAALVAKRDAALAREAALKARVQELTDENIALKLRNEALAATMTALQQENFELATNFAAKTRENQEKADKLAAQALLLEAEAQKVAAAEAKLVANQAATDAATVGLANVAEALTITMGGSREKVRADGNDAADEAEVVVAVALVSGAINAPRLVDGRDDIIAGLKRDLQALLDAGKEKTSLVASAAGLDTTSTSPKKGGVWRGFLNVFSGGGGKKKDKRAASGAIAAVAEVNDGDVSEHSAEADQSLQARIADLLAQIDKLERLQQAGPVMASEVDALVQELKARLGNTVALTDNEVRLRRDLEDSKAALTVLQAQYDKDKAAWQTEREQMQGQINAFTVRVDAAEKEAADAQATSVEDKAARLDAERKLATLQNALEAPESEKPLSEVARNQGEYISIEERSAVNPDPELQHLKIDNQLKLERIEKLEKQLQLAIITAKLALAAGNEGVVETAQAGGERLSQPAVATLADTAIERPSAQEQTYMGRLQNLDGRLKMLVGAGVDGVGYPKTIQYGNGNIVYVENQDGGFVGIFTPKDGGPIQIEISADGLNFAPPNAGEDEAQFLNLDNAINLLLQAQQDKLASDTEALRHQQAELQRQRDEFVARGDAVLDQEKKLAKERAAFESEKEVFAQMKEPDATKYSAAVPTVAITTTVSRTPKAKTPSSAKKNGVTWGSAEYITTMWGAASTSQNLYTKRQVDNSGAETVTVSFEIINSIAELINHAECKMTPDDKRGAVACIEKLKESLGEENEDYRLRDWDENKSKEIAGLIYKGTYTGKTILKKTGLSLLDYVNKYNDLAKPKSSPSSADAVVLAGGRARAK